MQRRLIEYLPAILRSYREMKGITDGQQWLFEKLWDEAERVLNNQFIDTADEYGIGRWESILQIIPRGIDTIEERRFRIKTRLNEQLPFTIRTLRQQLEALCGQGGATANISQEGYLLIVRIALTAKSNFNDVKEMLNRVVPANIAMDLSLLYNQHMFFKNRTHGLLKQYRHSQLKNEVF